MGGGGGERGEVGAEEPGLAVFDQYVAFLELDTSGPQAFDFPALQHKTGLELFFNEVVMLRLFVEGDGVVRL